MERGSTKPRDGSPVTPWDALGAHPRMDGVGLKPDLPREPRGSACISNDLKVRTVHGSILYERYNESATAFVIFPTARSSSLLRMPDRHLRLQKARLLRRFADATAAAKAFGWNENTYRSNENGNASFSFKKAEVFGAAFGVNSEWLYSGKGPMRGRPGGLSIVGYVGAGGEGHYEDDYAMGGGDELDPLPTEDHIALRVRGDSMCPRFNEGEILIFGPARDPVSLLGKEVMARLADGRKLVKVLRRGFAPGQFDLYSINTAHAPIENVELEWALPFVALRT